ncbi:MAG: methionine--tRNA ligase [Desulfofustis sp. PB-SRB1]|jgi:methionyl-tRNA synthetase|nr:methionine--tRNA ligase [Desulfofustis sp. PB-SRB1]MBM1003168.1 methionine--tRNA ligase [Desulfofustis sp. PB-SRB1]HBH27423.1 methionine--tRNA ligase [Desulfofustis sp.]
MTTYITTPIYYVNAQPHLGHAYTTIVADTYNRFCRLRGEASRFQTGTDEHGDKIVEAAAGQGVEPQTYVDSISAQFRQTWPLLGVEYDRFIRTTDADHVNTVRHILQAVYDQGDIYFDSYSGLYCTGCERFLIERELVDGKCPDHLVAPKPITEQNYFFRMSRYQQRLIDHIEANPDFITPARYRNEVLSFLSDPLEDLCISRPTSRLSWGIPLPFDADYVTYVWFDALINYLTGAGYPDNPDYMAIWGGAEHLIAKDILKPHAIYWPTMLMAADVPLYRKLHVHGYWNVAQTKMSKSLGNVVRPADMVADFGIDTIRYFLLREMTFGLDASFSNDAIIARSNADLANDLGNLCSRALTMIVKYCDGRVPEPAEPQEIDQNLAAAAHEMVDSYCGYMADFQFHRGLQQLWGFIGEANRYIVATEPWNLAKAEDGVRLATVMYNLAESLRIIGVALQPVMPATARTILENLGVAADDPSLNTFTDTDQWGRLPVGTTISKGKNLFPRLSPPSPQGEKSSGGAGPKKKKHKGDDSHTISIGQFKAIDLRVAQVVAAERVPKSKKLLELVVDVGEKRTVVAGIGESYEPQELLGKMVVVVVNLEPATLMGVTSNGMVLAAATTGPEGVNGLSLVSPEAGAKPGDKVS